MYYLELIERFWVFNKNARIGSTAVAMYLYLLKVGKDNDNYHFKVSDIVLSKELGLTRQTVRTTKGRLRDLGLIQFQTQNGVSGTYRLLLNYSLDTTQPVKIEKAKGKDKVIRTFKSPSDENPLIGNGGFESPSGNSDDENKISLHQLSNENVTIPEFEEFLTYAQTLSSYHPELDLLVQDKFYNWKNNGWKKSSGRHITNWKSSLKSILPFLKNADHDDQLSLQTIPDIKRPKSNIDK